MSQERTHHIDVLKGILILLVVFGHIYYAASLRNTEELNALPYLGVRLVTGTFVMPYYMAAFFFVTGYCSRFSRGITEQVTIDFRRLVIPAVVIPLLFFENVFSTGLSWFLMAMFFGKIVLKVILDHIAGRTLKFIILSVLSVLGCFCLYHFPEYNFLSIFHALIFSFFIWLGHEYKNGMNLKPSWMLLLLLYSFLVLFIRLVLNEHCPAVCSTINFEYYLWPLYVLLSVVGTYLVFVLSVKINSNRLLEYLGRNSLVIYLTHGYMLFFMSGHLKEFILDNGNNGFVSSLIILSLFIAATIFGSLCSWLFNLPYLRVILGKW